MSRLAAVVSLGLITAACGGDSTGASGATLPAFGGVPPSSPAALPTTPGAPGIPAGTGASPTTSTPGAPASETPSAGLPLGGTTPSATPGEQTPVPGASASIASPLPRSTPEAEGLSSQGVLNLVNALDG